MTSLALAYQVQCRLCDEMNYESKGFDQPFGGTYAVAAGVSRALGLVPSQTANVIGISGASGNPLYVTRLGTISHWKGFAYAGCVFNAVHAAFLAMRGVTGPLTVFEGPRGAMDAITGPIEIDWERENLEKIPEISIKKYNSGLHAQTAIEGALEMESKFCFSPEEVERFDIETYEYAHYIMGGGKGGDRHVVPNKETADHSLPYVVAVALLDGQVMPAQYEMERILREDVQGLLRKVYSSSSDELTGRYPKESSFRFKVTLKDGTVYKKEKSTCEGFFTNPMSWEMVLDKFVALSEPHAGVGLRDEIVDAVSRLESIRVNELTAFLEKVGKAA